MARPPPLLVQKPSFLVEACCSPSPATHLAPYHTQPGARTPSTIQRDLLFPIPRRCHARSSPRPPALGGGPTQRLQHAARSAHPIPPQRQGNPPNVFRNPTSPGLRLLCCCPRRPALASPAPPPAAPLDLGPSSGPSFSPLPSRGGSGGSWKGRDEVILSLGVSWWRRGCGRRERARGEERNVQVRGIGGYWVFLPQENTHAPVNGLKPMYIENTKSIQRIINMK